MMVVSEATPRNVWPLGKVLETMPDKNGLVRQVKVRTKTGILTRPVDKLCLLLEAEIPDTHQPVTAAESATVKDDQKPRSRRMVKPKKRLDL